jgi:hypothetical protein
MLFFCHTLEALGCVWHANLVQTCFGTWAFPCMHSLCGNLEKIKAYQISFQMQKTCTQNKHTSYMSCTNITPKLHDMLNMSLLTNLKFCIKFCIN